MLAGKIHKDKESGLGLATPRKKPSKPLSSVQDDGDELADLLGGLAVDQKKCEVCLNALTREEMKAGDVRCTECNKGLKSLERGTEPHKQKKNNKGVHRLLKKKTRRPIVLDSDEEDETGQAEEGTDTDEEDTSFAKVGDNSGFIDSEAEESDTPESSQECGSDGGEEELNDSDYDEGSYSQLIVSTKIKYLLRILKKEVSAQNKTIVFSQFTSMLDLIEPFLHKEAILFTRYDGSMKNDDREASLRRLRGEGEYKCRKGYGDSNFCGVLLCSLKCGALGLNLTAACRVVILEPFWNPVCPLNERL